MSTTTETPAETDDRATCPLCALAEGLVYDDEHRQHRQRLLVAEPGELTTLATLADERRTLGDIDQDAAAWTRRHDLHDQAAAVTGAIWKRYDLQCAAGELLFVLGAELTAPPEHLPAETIAAMLLAADERRNVLLRFAIAAGYVEPSWPYTSTAPF